MGGKFSDALCEFRGMVMMVSWEFNDQTQNKTEIRYERQKKIGISTNKELLGHCHLKTS